MASSVWSGHLTFGMISIPVKLFSAARSQGISFNMLHRDDLSRLKQQYICLADGQVVERSEVVKGYEYKKDEYVVVLPEEIKEVEPKTGKEMQLLEFVEAKSVDPIYLESSYYIGPDDAGRVPYALLTKAMESGSYYGIAQLTMHNREYTVIIRPYKGGLCLHTMYYQDEVRDPEFKVLSEVPQAQVAQALKLVEAMVDDFEPSKYSDSFQEALKELIQSKLEGSPIKKAEKIEKKSAVPDILDALKASLAQMEEKKAKKGKKNGK
jgi:DNA end-binding protein Ku